MNASIDLVRYCHDIVGSINVALLVVDKDLVVEFANPAYYAAFGTSAAKTIGHRLFHDHEALLADDRLQALLTAVAEHGVTVDRYSANAQRADGNPSAVNIAAKRIRRQGISTDRTLILISDVTEEARERTQSFNEVERSHAQIVEINHRVKNNLGSVLAMLRMEHRLVRGTKAAGILERIALRVESIATLYELLAINSNTGSIQLLAYFRSLGGSIEKVAGAEDGGWTITVTGDDALLNVEEAINIGAVVNELVANAAKYAFRRMPVGGRISIDVKVGTGRLAITVADNGSGIEEPVRDPQSTGLGMKLVKVYLQAMDGAMERKSRAGEGTTCVLHIPYKRHAPTATDEIPAEMPHRNGWPEPRAA